MFIAALDTLAKVIEQTNTLSLLTDGERRYGNLLFEICHEVIKNGKPGRSAKATTNHARKSALKTRVLKSASVGNAKNIKLLFLSIPKRLMRLKTKKFMPIIWKLLMLPCGDAKPTPILNLEKTYKERSMCFGCFTILFEFISPLKKLFLL
jgi:hypothetical protein